MIDSYFYLHLRKWMKSTLQIWKLNLQHSLLSSLTFVELRHLTIKSYIEIYLTKNGTS